MICNERRGGRGSGCRGERAGSARQISGVVLARLRLVVIACDIIVEDAGGPGRLAALPEPLFFASHVPVVHSGEQEVEAGAPPGPHGLLGVLVLAEAHRLESKFASGSADGARFGGQLHDVFHADAQAGAAAQRVCARGDREGLVLHAAAVLDGEAV